MTDRTDAFRLHTAVRKCMKTQRDYALEDILRNAEEATHIRFFDPKRRVALHCPSRWQAASLIASPHHNPSENISFQTDFSFHLSKAKRFHSKTARFVSFYAGYPVRFRHICRAIPWLFIRASVSRILWIRFCTPPASVIARRMSYDKYISDASAAIFSLPLHRK